MDNDNNAQTSWRQSLDLYYGDLIENLVEIIDIVINYFKQKKCLTLPTEKMLSGISNDYLKCSKFLECIKRQDREHSIIPLSECLCLNYRSGLADKLLQSPLAKSTPAPAEIMKPPMSDAVEAYCKRIKVLYSKDEYSRCEALVLKRQSQPVTKIYVNTLFTVYNSKRKILQKHETLITRFLCEKQFQVTVVVGNASSGKTTVRKKLCYDWLTDKYHTFSLIVVIECEKLNRIPVDSFEDLLDYNSVFDYPEKGHYIWSNNLSENCVKDWIMKHSAHVLFILENFEEYINENVSYCNELNYMLGLETSDIEKRNTWNIVVLMRPYPEMRLFCADHAPKACLVKLGGIDSEKVDNILKRWWDIPETQQLDIRYSLSENDRNLLANNPLYLFALRDMVLSHTTIPGTSGTLTLQAVCETACDYLLRQLQQRIELRQLLHGRVKCSFANRRFSCCESSFDYDETSSLVSFCKRIMSKLAFKSFKRNSETVPLNRNRFRQLCPHIALDSGLLIAEIPQDGTDPEYLKYLDDSMKQYLAAIYTANRPVFVNIQSNKDPKVYIHKLIATLFRSSISVCEKDKTVLHEKIIFDKSDKIMTRCKHFFRFLFAQIPDAFSEVLAKELISHVRSLPSTYDRLATVYGMQLWYIEKDSSNSKVKHILKDVLTSFYEDLHCEANDKPSTIFTKLHKLALENKQMLVPKDALDVIYGSSTQPFSTSLGTEQFQICAQPTPGMDANYDIIFVSQDAEHQTKNWNQSLSQDIREVTVSKNFFFTGSMSGLIHFLSNTKFFAHHTSIFLITNQQRIQSDEEPFHFSDCTLDRFRAEQAGEIFDLSLIYNAVSINVELLVASSSTSSDKSSECCGIQHYVKNLVLKRSGFSGSPSSFIKLHSEYKLKIDEATAIFRADLGETDPFTFDMRKYRTGAGVVPMFDSGDHATRNIAITQLMSIADQNKINVVTDRRTKGKGKLNLDVPPAIVEIVGSLEFIFCVLHKPMNQLNSNQIFLRITESSSGHENISSIALTKRTDFKYRQYGISGTIVVEELLRTSKARSIVLLSAKHGYDIEKDQTPKLEHDYGDFHAAYIGPFAGAFCAVSSTFFNPTASYAMHIMFDDIKSELNKFSFINAICHHGRIFWAVGKPVGKANQEQNIVIVQEKGMPDLHELHVEQQLSTLHRCDYQQLKHDIMSAKFLWLHVSLPVFVELARCWTTLACITSACFLQRYRKCLSLKCVTDVVETATDKQCSFGIVDAYIRLDGKPTHSVVRIVHETCGSDINHTQSIAKSTIECMYFIYYGSVDGLMAFIQNQALHNLESARAEDEELQGGILNFDQVFDSPIQPPIVCKLLLARLEPHTFYRKYHDVRFMVRELRTNAKTVRAAYECCLTIVSETTIESNDEWSQQDIRTECFAFKGQLSLLDAVISSTNVVASKCIFKITDFPTIDGQKRIESTYYYINDPQNCYKCVIVRNDNDTRQACVYSLCPYKKPWPESNDQALRSIEQAFPLKAELCFFHGEAIDLLYIVLNNGLAATETQIVFSSSHGPDSDLFYSCDTAQLQTYCMSLSTLNVKVEMIDKLPQQNKHDKILVIPEWAGASWESYKKLQKGQFRTALNTGKACVVIALNLENLIGIVRTIYRYLQNTCYVGLVDNEQIILLQTKKFCLKNHRINFLHYSLPKDPQGPISSLEFYVEDIYAETTELIENDYPLKDCQNLETSWFEFHGSVSSFCSLLRDKELKVTETLHVEFWSVTPLNRDEQTTVVSLHCTPAYNSKPISESVYFQLETGIVSMTVIDISHEKWFILYVESNDHLSTSKFADIHPIKKRIASAETGPTLIAYKGSPVLLHDLTTKELVKDNVQIILQLSDSEVSGPLELMPRLQLENGFCYGFKKLYDDKGVFAYFIRQFDADDSIINNSADRPMESRIHDKLEAKYVYFTGQLEGFSKLAALDDLPDAEYHYITSLDIKHQTSADIEHQRICLKRYIDDTTAYKIVKFNDIQSNLSSKTFLTVCCETSDADKKSLEFHELDPHWSQTDHFVYVGREQNFSDLVHRGIISPQNFFILTHNNEHGTAAVIENSSTTADHASIASNHEPTNLSPMGELPSIVASQDQQVTGNEKDDKDATTSQMTTENLNSQEPTHETDIDQLIVELENPEANVEPEQDESYVRDVPELPAYTHAEALTAMQQLQSYAQINGFADLNAALSKCSGQLNKILSSRKTVKQMTDRNIRYW